MISQQLERMQKGQGFIAALDQSGGSTPKALRLYGIMENAYANEAEMFDLVHQMRVRIMVNPAFNSDHVLGAILFENTMNRTVEGDLTADYLWKRKGIVPFLKIDQGLAEERNGVQLMKPIPGLDKLLSEAVKKNIFGTKMRSVIKKADPVGIAEVIKQQFDLAGRIIKAGLVPIIEPEADINSPDRRESEKILKQELKNHLAALSSEAKVMLKLSIPVEDNFYADLLNDSRIVRIVALSGGYSREEANAKLARNHGIIASFSRALTEGLSADQTEDQFTAKLKTSIEAIYQASIT